MSLKKRQNLNERRNIMKPRSIDEVGRIVIPKPMRDELGINAGDDLAIYTEGNKIIIEKRNPHCVFCGLEDGLTKYNGKNVCKSCLDNLKNL